MSVLEIEGSFEGKTTIKLNSYSTWYLLREIHCLCFDCETKGKFFFQALKRCLRCACFYELKTSHYIPINLFSTVSWFCVSKDNCGWSTIEKCYNSVLLKWNHLLAFTDCGVLWAVLGSWQVLLGPLCLPVPCMPGFTLRPDGPVILLQRGWYCPASSEELCTWEQDEENWLVGPQTSVFQRAWPHPRPTNAKVGVHCCGVWRCSAVGEPKKCCHPVQPGLCLPSHFCIGSPLVPLGSFQWKLGSKRRTA